MGGESIKPIRKRIHVYFLMTAYYEDENIHYALRKKLSNAWYQKKHREEKKVKKPHYYALTKRAREALLTLAFKNGVSEEQMIERLINETYAKECCSVDGENLYL